MGKYIQSPRNRCHLWASLSSHSLDLPLNLTLSKIELRNLLRWYSTQLQKNVSYEWQHWQAMLLQIQIVGKMQKEMDGHSPGTSAHVPQQKSKSNVYPGRSLAATQKLSLGTAVLVSIPIWKGMIRYGYTNRISFSVPEERLLDWMSFIPKRGTNNKHCPMQLLWDKYIMLQWRTL